MPLVRRTLIVGLGATAAAAVVHHLHAQSALFMPPGPPPAATPPSAEPAPPAPAAAAAAPADPEPAPPPASPELPPWRRYAVAVDRNDPRPKIAVVIDDLGVMRAHTATALALPGPLTLAWFPFAPDLPAQVREGAARGHEAMLHMPMQSHSNSTVQTGPNPLRIDLPPEVNLARLRAAFDAVPEIVGLNNHMGSVATRDPALMALVAQETRARGMLFLDSLVIPHSEGIRQAELAGVPAAARDVFIDNTANPAEIRAQLTATEATAQHFGYAIAIGHPRPHTLAALAEWLPTLPRKGFVLWPIAATVALRNCMEWPVSV